MKKQLSLVKLLNEAGGTGAVGGFVGGKGQRTDKVKDGPFYPSVEAKNVLKDQVKNSKKNKK